MNCHTTKVGFRDKIVYSIYAELFSFRHYNRFICPHFGGYGICPSAPATECGKRSIEQDVEEWDSLIDSLYLDSNDVPSLNAVDWAYAVLDSQSILYSSAELSNSLINDSSLWLING